MKECLKEMSVLIVMTIMVTTLITIAGRFLGFDDFFKGLLIGHLTGFGLHKYQFNQHKQFVTEALEGLKK